MTAWFPIMTLVLSLTGFATAEPADDKPFWIQEPRQHPPPVPDLPALQPERPRLVFRPEEQAEPGARTFKQVRALYARDPVFQNIFRKALKARAGAWHPAKAAACWIATEDGAYARLAIELLQSETIVRSGPPYSDIWSFALAYDWLYAHALMTPNRRAAIEKKIAAALDHELNRLDGPGLALWHGRNQVANNAMIAALALDGLPEHRDRLRRAAAHYADALRALQHTEAWPEGASYWIYNRAAPYAMAADCVMTAFNTDTLAGIPMRQVMRRIGYWTLYQFGPNDVFEPYGDSQGSLKLGETGWWEVTADYFARLSDDPGVMAGADYIRNRSPNAYGKRPYYWNIVITYNPAARPPDPAYDPEQPELWMRENLPQAMLFGRHSMGLAFFRSAWGDPDATYATFNAGDFFAHHEHCDVGHFGIRKGGWLAPRTGVYAAGFTSAHRLGYMVQTVSANSLLILAPNETSGNLASLRKGSGWAWLSGGQRVIRPTGFNCLNFDHFLAQRRTGLRLERATVTAFESVAGQYDYIAADITSAYNSTRMTEPGQEPKVSLVTRAFLFLRPLDAFVVYDRVETTRPEYRPKFLLHHVLSKPVTDSERLLAGQGPDNGILETLDRVLVTEHERGRLEHRIVLPSAARALKIGGPDFNAYVEQSGTQADGFTGTNLGHGDPFRIRGSTHQGLWRTEVEPRGDGTSVRFLNVLLARLKTDEASESIPVAELDAGKHAHAARIGDWATVFAREPGFWNELNLTLPAALRVLAFDAEPGRAYAVAGRATVASPEGVLDIGTLPAGTYIIRP